MIVGLTGGIGCGKSTVLSVFKKMGYSVLEADKLGHLVLEAPDSKDFLIQTFGEKVVENGHINRSYIANVVFSDNILLECLEAFLHPKINKIWQEKIAEDTRRDWIVEIPLLFEKKYESKFDKTISVYVSEKTQIKRMEKRSYNKAAVLQRKNKQMPIEEKVEKSSFCIFNEGSIEFLEKQIIYIIKHLKEIEYERR